MPEGIRVNFYSAGGEVTGPRIRGKVRPVGGDWVTVRKDGVVYLDVRTTFETHDGALILVTYQGLADFGEDGHDQFLRGEMPPVVKLRTSPRFVTKSSRIPLAEPALLHRHRRVSGRGERGEIRRVCHSMTIP